MAKVYSIESLNARIEQANRNIEKQKVNHLLHFFLSIFTVGIWILVWILITISSKLEINRLEKDIAWCYAEKNKTAKSEKQQEQKSQQVNETPIDTTEQLLKLAELKEKGLLTEEEFATQKAKILNS